MNGKKICIALVLTVVVSLLTGACSAAMPKPEKIELPNHLKVIVLEDHSLPVVTLELLASAGSRLDPPDMKGLANLTVKSLLLGTRSLSFDVLNDRLDFIGATLGAECSRDFATVNMKVLKQDLDAGARLFTDIMLHPSFSPADVDGQKDEIIGSLAQEENDPLKVANRAFDKALFLKTPYADPVEGTRKSVAAIGPAELFNFYSSFYRPNDSVLVIGGDITPWEVKTLIIPGLMRWKAAEVPEEPFREQFAKGPVTVVIDKPVPQAAIIIGCPVMARASGDYYPFLVMNRVLESGGLSSIQGAVSPIGKAGGCEVESRLAAWKHGGSFRVVVRTKNVSVKKSAALVQKALERLWSEPVSKQELQAAKKSLIGNFPLKYRNIQDLVSFMARIEFYGLGPDYPGRYAALINSVTSEDILRVAKKYLEPDNVTVVVANLKNAQIK